MEGTTMATERKTKKRGPNEGTIFKRADGRWCAQPSLGYVNGKRHRPTIYGQSYAEVRDKLARVLANAQQGIMPANKRITVTAFLDQWLEDSVKPSRAPRTYASYAETVRLHLVPALGRIMLDKLTPQDVQRMMRAGERAGLAARTVSYHRTVLRIALGQAVKWGMIGRNVAALVAPPKAVRYEGRTLTPDEAKQLLKTVGGDRLEALYAVALAVGLRQGEALGLRWQDIDLEGRTLTVRNQMQRINGKLTLTEPKTAHSRRTVALPSVVVAALHRHCERQAEERAWAGSRWQESGLVFTTAIGTPLNQPNLRRAFCALLDRAGLPMIRFHDLRHSAASLLLAQGASPRVIMETLGHANIGITMNLYTHVMPALLQETAAMMNRVLTEG